MIFSQSPVSIYPSSFMLLLLHERDTLYYPKNLFIEIFLSFKVHFKCQSYWYCLSWLSSFFWISTEVCSSYLVFIILHLIFYLWPHLKCTLVLGRVWSLVIFYIPLSTSSCQGWSVEHWKLPRPFQRVHKVKVFS